MMNDTKLNIVSFFIGFLIFSLLTLFFSLLGYSFFAKAFKIIGYRDWHQYLPDFFFLFVPLLAGLVGGLRLTSRNIARQMDNAYQSNLAASIKKVGDYILYFLLGCICIPALYISFEKLNL